MPYVDPRGFPGLYIPGQTYTWEKVVYTVPMDTSEERIQATADKYRNKAGAACEKQGFTVLGIDGPHRDYSLVAKNLVPPDRKRYVMWVKVTRAPAQIKVEVAEKDISEYEKIGLKLDRS